MADMALIVGHRIRGLVTTIEGFTDLLADTLADREQRELALRIFEGAARIESILADLQMFAQPVAPVRSQVRTSMLIDDLAAAVSDEVIDRVDFFPGTGASVSVDRMLIRQALLVLVQNAADATTPDDMIRLAVEEADGFAVFHVSNPGLMNVDVARDAFRPFYTTKAHNLGVGLPIARRIARAHGGRLDLTANDSDGGIRFTMQLPLADGGDVVGEVVI